MHDHRPALTDSKGTLREDAVSPLTTVTEAPVSIRGSVSEWLALA
jgi:hypothetical protein